MDEIKSVISQLPPQDITILKTLYSPDSARQELSQNGQRLIPILDGLSTEEQQEVVNVQSEDLPQPEGGDVNVEVSETNMQQMPEGEVSEGESDEERQQTNPAGNFEDYLI